MRTAVNKLKRSIVLNAKNLAGYKTDRKIVAFSVDDYGNVRLHSREAREKLDTAGLNVHSRFDALDTMETREDLEALFHTLSSVKDINGRPAVFTAFALPCNIDFERIKETGCSEYLYETLPKTFRKLSALDPEAYSGTWDLWKEGISKKLIVPQFHGREHLNVRVFEEKLQSKDPELLACMKNRSFTSISNSGYKTVSPMGAFDFWTFEENEPFHGIIKDGISRFEEIFGFRPRHFTPPVYNAHPVLYKTLQAGGIRFIDTAMFVREHLGEGRFRRKFNITGKKVGDTIRLMVRNVVFEPSGDYNIDWPEYAMKQIEAAFRWNRPAIISSHRVNFCGRIDSENRRKGLQALRELLERIIIRWPDVEFMSADELGDLIPGKK